MMFSTRQFFIYFLFMCVYVRSSLEGMASERKYDWSIPTFELAFDLAPGNIDCLYEHVDEGGKFKFTFRVMNSATPFRSNYISVYIRDPKGQMLIKFPKQRQMNMPMFTAENEGYYEFCFDNTADTFSSKKVEAFIAVVVAEDPFKINLELAKDEELNQTMESYDNLMNKISHIHYFTSRISNQLHMQRRLENADLADLLSYQLTIRRYSILTILVIISVAYFHTWSIKRLFENQPAKQVTRA